MNKKLRPIVRIITSIGISLLAILLERSIQRTYLTADIYESFYSHWIYYLIISVVLTSIVLRAETKKQGSSKIVKLISVIIFFACCFFFSNRIELWLNSKTLKAVKDKNYIVQQKGITWGEIGIKDLITGKIDRLKINEDELKGIVERDTISLKFKEGIFGIKYSPIIKK